MQGRNVLSVKLYNSYKKFFQMIHSSLTSKPSFSKAYDKSAKASGVFTPTSLPRATTIMSYPQGTLSQSPLYASRITRLARLLSTAFPYFFETVSPNAEGLCPSFLRFRAYTARVFAAILFPCLYAREKTELLLTEMILFTT